MISILFIDDEQVIRDLVRTFLEITGELSVEAVPSVEEGIERMKGTIYDAIVCDYEIPGGMNAIQFLTRLREGGSTIPFLIFTGRGQEEVAIEAINHGADFYIQKGESPRAQFTDLVQKISQAVQRRRAETALRESEKSYRDLIENHPDLILTTDRNGDITYLNRAGTAQLGIRPDPSYHQPWTEVLDPATREPAQEEFARMLASGEPVAGLPARVHDVKKQKSVPVVLSATVLRDDQGAVRGARVVIRDLSQGEEAREGTSRAGEILDLVRQVAPVAIITVDRRVVVTSWNPGAAVLFGWGEGEAVRKRLPIVPKEKNIEFHRIFSECTGSGIRQRVPFLALRKDQELIDVILYTAPLHDAAGTVAGVLLIALRAGQ